MTASSSRADMHVHSTASRYVSFAPLPRGDVIAAIPEYHPIYAGVDPGAARLSSTSFSRTATGATLAYGESRPYQWRDTVSRVAELADPPPTHTTPR